MSKTPTIAEVFNVSAERIKEQYKANAEGLKKMYEKAVYTGKKVNGYTSKELQEMYYKYLDLSI